MLGPRSMSALNRFRLLSIIEKEAPNYQRSSQSLITRREISLAGWMRKRKRLAPNENILDHTKSGRTQANNIASHESSNGSHNNPTPSQLEIPEFSPERFFNPWRTLAELCPSEEMLSDKVENTTRTFGIVAALMGSLAAALLTLNPYDGYDANREPVANDNSTNEKDSYEFQNGLSRINKNKNGNQLTYDNQPPPFSPLLIKRRNTSPNFIEHVTFTHHVSGTSLLVSWGIPESKLDDIYTACCAGSFYAGVGTTVLSSVINAWLAATPPGGVRTFVRMHSWFIVAMPAMLGISTGLAGGALFIGLDRTHGTPVSYIGLAGTTLGGLMLAFVTGRGWLCTYRSLTQMVMRSGRKRI